MINFSGHATDGQDGTLPASALKWDLILQHCPSNCHSHPLQSFDGVSSGSFSAPDHEYPSYLELKLTATDSGGLTNTKVLRLDPRTVELTFQTNPGALSLTLDGASSKASFTRTVIVGSAHTISAPSPQQKGQKSLSFQSWSDGGARSHSIVAGAAATTYTPPDSSKRGAVVWVWVGRDVLILLAAGAAAAISVQCLLWMTDPVERDFYTCVHEADTLEQENARDVARNTSMWEGPR